MYRVYVLHAPRHRPRVFQSGSDLAAAIAFVRAQPELDRSSLIIRLSDASADDIGLCVPLRMFEDAASTAAAVVKQWDDRWLLIESTTLRHRACARDQLVQAIAAALATAAAASTPGADDIVF